ncbi:aminodeoxychorismate lyase [Zobellella maritima]|uniref:aminodeoxychorismate lyase n=1 Tax=Zobellella maritima TaxID=2059725 RepID=UPI000E309130|nr:aminodeoxychorismate lyase [Zobellella maritima]
MDATIIDTDSCSALRRGWQLGDGHFTTIHGQAGRLRLWPYHQARLAEACARLQMVAPDWARLHEAALAQVAGNDEQVLRISLLRGPGARGYGIAGCGETTVVFNQSPFPAYYHDWRQTGIALGLCRGRLGSSPLLAGLKTINRLEQVLLKAELEEAGLDEGLVLNEADELVEAVTANLFWRRGQQVFTPDLSRAGVAGTMRSWVIDTLAEWGQRVQPVRAGLAALQQADEIWLTNALMGVVPVASLTERVITSFPTVRQLQCEYEKRV